MNPSRAYEHVPPQPPGMHCLVELYDCPAPVLDDEDLLRGALKDAVSHGMATLLELTSRKFSPQGVTALALIAESHVAVHTWPERGYAAVDVFTCGDQASAERAALCLIDRLQAGRFEVQRVIRGRQLQSSKVRHPQAIAPDAQPVLAPPPAPAPDG
jgi:S-adenosylmethionine decarboxylase